MQRYADRIAWLGRPYEREELLNDLLRMHLLLGPVELDVDADFQVRGAAVRWSGTSEPVDLPGYRPGTTLSPMLAVEVSDRHDLNDFGALLFVDILKRHAADLAWSNYPSRPLPGEAQVALKCALDEFLTRLAMLRAYDNPIRVGRIEVEIVGKFIGLTHYLVRIGDTVIPGEIRGNEREALEAAKRLVKRHATALGELL